MSAFDWSGLRVRRLAVIAAALLILPGSCVATAVDRGAATALIGVGALAVALGALRAWPCPRCAERFAGPARWPFVRPFGATCAFCGVPDFTPTADDAPPFRHVDVVPSTREPGGAMRWLRSPRARVAVVFAMPLVWMSVCRQPSGDWVRLGAGEEVEVLGIVRVATRSAGAERRSLVLSYYAPRSPVAPGALLDLTRSAVEATGDSTVVLREHVNTWWARNLGLRATLDRVYVLGADGAWRTP
jgi:hypothetical protein